MPGTRHFIVATAGHVDHGKSTLVEALTGTHPDRLPEEKARGITIDLGFASLDIASPSGEVFQIGIVDVPGHEDFVKNMVAGVGAADVALLVVAADDGWMPQTEEHVQLLTYFGVGSVVVALTKADLTPSLEQAMDAVRLELKGTLFADAPMVPTSIVSGLGIEELRVTFARVLGQTTGARDIGKPRLAIDRAFSLTGIGTVVTGTLVGGELHSGQQVVVQPSGRRTRIRRMQSHNLDVDTSGPGTRTALNLPDLAVGDVRRGDVVTLAELGNPSQVLDTVVEISSRGQRAIKNGARVHVHYGSGHVGATAALLDADEVSPGGRALVQLRLDRGVFVFEGDRFTVRDWAEQATLAGGTVLDTAADPRVFRSPRWRGYLQRRADTLGDPVGWVESLLVRDTLARRSGLLANSVYSQTDVDAAIDQLAAAHIIQVAGDIVCLASAWTTLLETAVHAIDAHHRTHSDLLGMSLTDLRSRLGPIAEANAAFDVLLLDMSARGFVRDGSLVRRATHQPALPASLQAIGAFLRTQLSAKPLDPPSRSVLTPDAVSVRTLRFLIDTGEAVEISADLILASETVTRAGDVIVSVIREKGAATLGDFRDRLACSRRVLVPLLDYFDRMGLTVREGDRRRLLG